MFYKILKRKMENLEKAEDVYKILFCKVDSIRKKYNLTYLGEVFERHEERGFSVDDVLLGVALGAESGCSFIDDSINTNQFQLFKSRYDSHMENYKAISHLGYIILLSSMNKQAEVEEELLSFIDKNKLNEDFLLLLEGFKDNVFILSDVVLKTIVTKLENEKFDIDFISLLNITLNDYLYKSVYANIRDITKILNLKSGMFKNKEVFKILNSYKKIGSNRIMRNDAFNMLKCFSESEDVFWLLNLKLAYETLAPDGNAIVSAKFSFTSYLKSSINIERDNFELFSKLNNVDFREKDFSNFDESKYLKLIKLYNSSNITVENIGRNIYSSSNFINQFKEAINNSVVSKTTFVDFYLAAISISDNMEDKEFFFNLVKETETSLSNSQHVTLIKAGLMDMEEAISFSKEDLIPLLYRDSDVDKVELSISILNNVLNGNIEFSNIYKNSFSVRRERYYSDNIYTCNFVCETLQEYIEKEDCPLSNEEKIELIQKLERFLYLISSSYGKIEDSLYVEFILNSFNSELYKTALNISKDDIKNISRLILSFDGVKTSNKAHILNKFAYSEREANLIALEKDYAVLKDYISNGCIRYSKDKLKSFLPKAEKLDVKDEYIKKLSDLAESLISLDVSDFTELIIVLYRENILSREKRNELMISKLDKVC